MNSQAAQAIVQDFFQPSVSIEPRKEMSDTEIEAIVSHIQQLWEDNVFVELTLDLSTFFFRFEQWEMLCTGLGLDADSTLRGTVLPKVSFTLTISGSVAILHLGNVWIHDDPASDQDSDEEVDPFLSQQFEVFD